MYEIDGYSPKLIKLYIYNKHDPLFCILTLAYRIKHRLLRVQWQPLKLELCVYPATVNQSLISRTPCLRHQLWPAILYTWNAQYVVFSLCHFYFPLPQQLALLYLENASIIPIVVMVSILHRCFCVKGCCPLNVMLTSLNKPHGSGSISFLTKLFFFSLFLHLSSIFSDVQWFIFCVVFCKKKKKRLKKKRYFKDTLPRVWLCHIHVCFDLWDFFFFVRLFLAVKSRCHVHIWWWILRQIDGYISGWIESRSHRNLYFTLFSLSFSLSLIACHISQSFVPIARPRLSDSACHGNFTE